MQNQRFKDIMKLEIDVTNKLLAYINSQIDVNSFLDDLDIRFDILDERNNIAFNIWLGVDYIDESGKSFIDKFLEDKSVYLSKVERDILREKSSSFVSLFEIIDFEDNTVVLKDILNNVEYQVLEPSIHNVIQVGEFLFTRIGNVLNNYIFMGDINYVPSSVKDIFLEELLVDYNLIIKDQKNLSMVDYLKKHSLNLYKIYNQSLIDVIDNEGDITSYVFDELDEFEVFLLNKYKDIGVKKHLANLTNIFDYALADNDMTLYDIDKLDLTTFFSESIQDGFINSQEELNVYINTLKIYLQFLSMVDSQYKESYKEILNISKNRFKIMEKLDTKNSFNLDKSLASTISYSLNDEAMGVLLDYDKFILYISDFEMKLTSTNKHIKRKDLIQLNRIFENSLDIDKKAPNQRDFPLVNLYFYASLYSGVIEIDKDRLSLTNKGYSLLRLADEEKFALLVDYLWSKDFIQNILGQSSIYIFESLRDRLAESLSSLNIDKYYSRVELHLDNAFGLNGYYRPFLDLGLIKITHDDNKISLTTLGKKVFTHILQKKNMAENSEVIQLNDFKKAKYNWEG